jgi:hypothetical protein
VRLEGLDQLKKSNDMWALIIMKNYGKVYSREAHTFKTQIS